MCVAVCVAPNCQDRRRSAELFGSHLAVAGLCVLRLRRPASQLERKLNRVVDNQNCSGCGVCVLVSPRLTMGLDADGFNRPTLKGSHTHDQDVDEAAKFAAVCPGYSLRAPNGVGRRYHPIFGGYVQAWQGWATDPAIRRAGSSGGILTALSDWLVSTGQVEEVASSGMSPARPTFTVPLTITSRSTALAAAGSRYAPVSNTVPGEHCGAFIGKPCEVSARSQLASVSPPDEVESPVLLSFFCAGTPSQHATDDLATKLVGELDQVTSLRYRGNGWPGEFVVGTSDGRTARTSYEKSWGSHLGKRLQDRCKLCADGTGEHADIAVGDYWAVDERGFPVFDDAEGISVVIARTQRGASLLAAAVGQNVLKLKPVDLSAVAAVQPLQTQRRLTLAGRLVGRRLSGRPVPRYRGYGLVKRMLEHPASNTRAALGTFARSTGLRK